MLSNIVLVNKIHYGYHRMNSGDVPAEEHSALRLSNAKLFSFAKAKLSSEVNIF